MKRLSRQSSLPSNPGGGSDRGSRTIVRAVLFASRFRVRVQAFPASRACLSPEPAGLAGAMKLVKKERVHEYNL